MRHGILLSSVIVLLFDCDQGLADKVPMATPRQHVLVVADDLKSFNHQYVQDAILPPIPKGYVYAGPIVMTISRTSDLKKKSLAKYRVIYLVNVQKLDNEVSRAVAARVKEGAGLCVCDSPELADSRGAKNYSASLSMCCSSN